MGEWKRVRIGDFLHRVKVPIKLTDDEAYNLVTVRMHHKGVVLRESKQGKLIGTNMYRVKTGQFILSGIDARHGAFGIVPEELDGAIVTNDFWYFDIDENVVSRDFFLWLTTTPLFLNACVKSSEGTTNRRRLQSGKFFDFEFHFPDIDEQHRLAERFIAIDTTYSSLKGEFEKQSDYFKRLRQSILQDAVEGKLTADWRKQHPVVKGDPQYDAVALLEQIKIEKVRLVKEGKIRKEKPLPQIKDSDKPYELPEGWEWCRIGNLGFINPRNYIDDDLDVSFSPMPLISGKYGISPQFEIKKWKEIKSGFTHFAEPDIANAKITPCFENSKACVFKHLINEFGAGTTELHVLRPVLVVPDYVYIFVKTSNFLACGEKLMTGAVGQKRVPADFFTTSQVLLPPLVQQQAIVTRVNSLMATIDELEKQVTERKGQAQMLMQVVLREAFN